jgi:polyisoprenoid-binding protein YceI
MTQFPASSAATASPATTWQIDPSHTLVEFAVRHMMVSTVKGRFGRVSGTLVLDEADLSRSSVRAELDAASITTGDEQRDGHLRSGDFFDVDTFPSLTFASSRVEPLGEDRARIVGDLTIRDVTREVVLEAELNGRGQSPFGKQVAGFSAHTSINRKDFGLAWNVGLEAGGVLVSDTVKIALEVEATADN